MNVMNSMKSNISSGNIYCDIGDKDNQKKKDDKRDNKQQKETNQKNSRVVGIMNKNDSNKLEKKTGGHPP